jgi:magnesium chelatase family protein
MAMNPCLYGPCDDPTHECNCTPPLLQRYISPISEPLLDRTDIHIDVPAVKYKELASSVTIIFLPQQVQHAVA